MEDVPFGQGYDEPDQDGRRKYEQPTSRESDAQLDRLHDAGREQFIEHTPRVRRNKGREAKRRRRQALGKVRGYIEVREAGVPDTHEPVIRCRDCHRLADPARATKINEPMCECPDMDETLENSANNGTKQNPESLVLARVSRGTLDARITYRAAQAAEEKAQTDAKAEILAERARLRAQRAE